MKTTLYHDLAVTKSKDLGRIQLSFDLIVRQPLNHNTRLVQRRNVEHTLVDGMDSAKVVERDNGLEHGEDRKLCRMARQRMFRDEVNATYRF